MDITFSPESVELLMKEGNLSREQVLELIGRLQPLEDAGYFDWRDGDNALTAAQAALDRYEMDKTAPKAARTLQAFDQYVRTGQKPADADDEMFELLKDIAHDQQRPPSAAVKEKRARLLQAIKARG